MLNLFREGEKPVKTRDGGCEWSGDEKSAAVVTRPLGGLSPEQEWRVGLLPPGLKSGLDVERGPEGHGGRSCHDLWSVREGGGLVGAVVTMKST